MIETSVLAFLAGLLSILSPCVFPIVPIVVGTALSQHRLGPVALATGLSLSFLTIGLLVATIGLSIGIDDTFVRSGGAVLLIILGTALLVPRLQLRVALAAGPVSNWVEQRFGNISMGGLPGQFCVGVLLGLVWSPCAGPTLGAASVMAAQGRNVGSAALAMFVFTIGAALPLLAIGLLSREALLRWRGRLLLAGTSGKIVLGFVLVASGALIITGNDRLLAAGMLAEMPSWLTDLATRF